MVDSGGRDFLEVLKVAYDAILGKRLITVVTCFFGCCDKGVQRQ